MNKDAAAPKSFKQKALYEFKRYWIISAYLVVFLGCFNLYRRLILAGVGMEDLMSYGWKLIEALVLAKVIMIGEVLGIGERHERTHLIVPVVRKSLLFGLFIVLFNALERIVTGLIRKESWDAIVHHIFAYGTDEVLARTVVMMVALVPFFAFIELERVLGPGKLTGIFFSKRDVMS
jgi:hypothetical protein